MFVVAASAAALPDFVTSFGVNQIRTNCTFLLLVLASPSAFVCKILTAIILEKLPTDAIRKTFAATLLFMAKQRLALTTMQFIDYSVQLALCSPFPGKAKSKLIYHGLAC